MLTAPPVWRRILVGHCHTQRKQRPRQYFNDWSTSPLILFSSYMCVGHWISSFFPLLCHQMSDTPARIELWWVANVRPARKEYLAWWRTEFRSKCNSRGSVDTSGVLRYDVRCKFINPKQLTFDRYRSKHYFALKPLVFMAVYCIKDKQFPEERYNNIVTIMSKMWICSWQSINLLLSNVLVWRCLSTKDYWENGGKAPFILK